MNNADSQLGRRARRWITFSIRSLLVAIFVVAGLTAWLGKHFVRTRIERPIATRIQADGGYAFYDYQVEDGRADTTKLPKSPKLVRWLLGDDFLLPSNMSSSILPLTTRILQSCTSFQTCSTCPSLGQT